MLGQISTEISKLGSHSSQEILDFSHNNLTGDGIEVLVEGLIKHPNPSSILGFGSARK